MSLYRVVISFMIQGMQYMAERGVMAMTPGAALDLLEQHLAVDCTRISDFKAWVSKPSALKEFSYDVQWLDVVGSNYTVKDLWAKRYG